MYTCFKFFERIIFFLFLLRNVNTQFTKQIGDSCTLSSGRVGECKPFDNCDSNLLKKEGGQPHICAWGDDLIVCCPKVTITNRQKSKSYQKCAEYAAIKCKSRSTHTIVGGQKVTDPSEFPHMALIGFGDPTEPEWLCGGALISEQYVLTAAHCTLSKERTKPVVALFGFVNIDDKEAFHSLQQISIANTTLHPDRNSSKYADIALFKLAHPVTFSKNVMPACLHEDTNIDAIKGTATGWGDITFGANTLSNNLFKTALTLRNTSDCSDVYPPYRALLNGIDERTQICAGDINKDTCQGDSGGPLQIYRSDFICMHNIIGITSFGKGCGTHPSIFTRVSYYVRWIENIVWP